jgi:hypothetical protein
LAEKFDNSNLRCESPLIVFVVSPLCRTTSLLRLVEFWIDSPALPDRLAVLTPATGWLRVLPWLPVAIDGSFGILAVEFLVFVDSLLCP